MNVRPASFRDLGRIEQLYREAAAREDDTVLPTNGDSPVPQHTLVRLWYGVNKTLSALVPIGDSGATLLVAEDQDTSFLGFIQAQGVPGQPKAWHVTHLCVASGGRAHFAGAPLIINLCSYGMEHGVTRFVVRVPLDSPQLSLFIEQGFTQYATEQILFRDDSAGAPRVIPQGDAPMILRPARREDVGAIHLLYLRTTPKHVAGVEGPSQRAWQSSFAQGWMARVGRDDVRHFVCERPGVVAWVAYRPGSAVRPGVLALMCDGQDAALREDVVDTALAITQPGPLSCVLRHYDSELIRALQQRGFEIYGSQLLLVRDLALKLRIQAVARKEKKPVLAHAGLARSLDVNALRPLRDITRSQPSSSPR